MFFGAHAFWCALTLTSPLPRPQPAVDDVGADDLAASLDFGKKKKKKSKSKDAEGAEGAEAEMDLDDDLNLVS